MAAAAAGERVRPVGGTAVEAALLPELASVRVHESAGELRIEVEVPEGLDLADVSARVVGGTLEIRLPRVGAGSLA